MLQVEPDSHKQHDSTRRHFYTGVKSQHFDLPHYYIAAHYLTLSSCFFVLLLCFDKIATGAWGVYVGLLYVFDCCSLEASVIIRCMWATSLR